MDLFAENIGGPAVSILYPLILGKKRLQSSPSATMREVMFDAYKGTNVTLSRNTSFSGDKIAVDGHKFRGLPALYQGYQLKIISGFLSQGVTFLVKGR